MLITTRGPFEIHYSPEKREFTVCEPGRIDEPLAAHETQRQAEESAVRLMKKVPGLPMPVFKEGMHVLERGRITSVNLDAGEMWFSYEEKRQYQQRMKLWGTAKVWPICAENEAVAAELQGIQEELLALELRRRAAMERLVRPMIAASFKPEAGA